MALYYLTSRHHFFQFSCRPMSIRSDAGKQFDSDQWKDFCRSYGANQQESSPSLKKIFLLFFMIEHEVAQGINVEPGKFGKKNKHRAYFYSGV